jgi:NCS1 family nucleobase:cation symporter-1
MVDYFVVKRGNIHTPSLFNPTRGSLYYYTRGWNLKALMCWVSAALFGVPGLIGAYHPTWVAEAAVHMYQTGWVICFAVAVTFYFAANLVLPAKVFPAGHHEGAAAPKNFESLAETEGYFIGETIIESGLTTGREPQRRTLEGEGMSVVSLRDVVVCEKV